MNNCAPKGLAHSTALLSLLVSLVGALPSLGQSLPILQLSSSPSSAEVSAAKAAFAEGTIVVTQNPNAAKFGALFNIALPGTMSLHRQRPPCIMAVRKTAAGSVRMYNGDRSGVSTQLSCQASFERWANQQSLVQGDTLAGWTFISDISPGRQYSPKGSQIEVSGSVYRANAVDANSDYYLAVINLEATTVDGYTLINTAIETWAAGPGGSNFPIFQYGPANPQEDILIGNNIPYASNLVGTYKHDVVTHPSATSDPGTSVEWQFHNTSSGKSQSATAAVIFKAPSGTSHFTLNFHAWASIPLDNVSYQPLIPVSAPVLSVPAVTYVTPGEATTINVLASNYLSWEVTGTPNFVARDSQAGIGNGSIPFRVHKDASSDTSAVFTFNTVPSSAAPQVSAFPLSAAVYVVAALPKSGILLAGGKAWDGTVLNTAQVWDPITGTLDPTNLIMIEARQWHTATLLLNGSHKGQVLLAGGFGANGAALTSTEFFDPLTGGFTAGPQMTHAHAAHCAVRLNNGNVLIMGGADETNQSTAVVDVYDAGGNEFLSSPLQLAVARQNFAATLLQDGNVLVTGGTPSLASYSGFGDAEFYNVSDVGGFQPISGLMTGRQSQASVLLTNGQVLVLGGSNPSTDPVSSAELYTENSLQPFSLTTGTLAPGRRYPAAVVLTDGTVLVIGGYNYASWITSYDPSSESFRNLSAMSENRDHPTAVLIHGTNTSFDEQVFVAGGVIPNTGALNGQLLELYNPTSNTWAAAGRMNSSRTMMTSTLFGLGTDSLPAGGK